MRRSAFAAVAGWLPPLLLLALLAGFYGATTSNPFASDDYLLVKAASRGLLEAMRYQGGYHYVPAGNALLSLEYTLWGTEPAGYHWTGIALLGIAGLLAAALGGKLGLGGPASWAAALLVITNGLIHEIPLWACAAMHSAATCFYLGSLIAFLGYVQSGGRRRYAVASTLLCTLALLTHEQSLSLPIAAGLLFIVARQDSAGGSWAMRWRDGAVPLGAMFAAAGGYTALKLALSDGTNLAPGLGTGVVSRAGASALHLLRLFLPNLGWQVAWEILDPPWHGLAKLLARVAVLAVGIAVFVALPRLGKVLALWAAAHVVMMVLAVGMASRHYLLPLVPASLLIGLLLERIADRLAPAGSGRQAEGRRWLIVALCVAPLMAIGLATASSRKAVWADAGRVAEQLLADAAAAAATTPGAAKLLVVDLPDGLDLGESEPAYIFRFGFEDALRWRLRSGPPAVVRLHSANPPPRTEPFGRATTAGELVALTADSRNLVLQYDPARRRLVELRPR